MHLFGVGDHGGGPTRSMLDAGVHWFDPEMVYPQMKSGAAQGFFSDVEGKLDTEHSPVWNYKTMAAGESKLQQPADGKISCPFGTTNFISSITAASSLHRPITSGIIARLKS